jgi:hypothetical protein
MQFKFNYESTLKTTGIDGLHFEIDASKFDWWRAVQHGHHVKNILVFVRNALGMCRNFPVIYYHITREFLV